MNLLDIARAELAALLNTRTATAARLDAVIAAAETEGRNLTDTESAEFATIRAELVTLDTRRDEIKARIVELEAEAEARAAAERDAAGLPTTTAGGSVARGGAVVRTEARTYSRDAERRNGRSFLRDIVNARFNGDMQAMQRLERHMAEERVERAEHLAGIEGRDIGTGAFAGLVVPQYLVDLVAPVVRAGRPFADICRPHDLPADGMTVELSRITTGSAAAAQATENAAVQETDMDDTLLSVPVRTVAGQQDVSVQAVMRGTGTDDIVVGDLVSAYHAELDRQILVADGTSGTHTGIRNVSGNAAVTYTDASPTAAELFPKLADLVQQIQAATNMGLTHFVFHPRRWWWFASQLSSTFPLLTVGAAGPQQVGQLGDTTYAATGASLFGARVILDRNIQTNTGAGTNEDTIYGVDATECHLWEDPAAPLLIRADEVGAGSLTVKFVVFGFSAFTAGRYPLATGDITGTGLVTPTF